MRERKHPDGARVAYREAGTGPGLGLLHSAMLSHREWEPLVEHGSGTAKSYEVPKTAAERERVAREELARGDLKFRLHGHKLHGDFVLASRRFPKIQAGVFVSSMRCMQPRMPRYSEFFYDEDVKRCMQCIRYLVSDRNTSPGQDEDDHVISVPKLAEFRSEQKAGFKAIREQHGPSPRRLAPPSFCRYP